jgi:hypothetical protein
LGRFAPPSRKSAADARIDEIVMRTLERERELRFQTVGEVKERVEAATEAKVGAGAKLPDPSRGHTVVIPSGKTARFANTAVVCTALSLIPAFFARLLLSPARELNGGQRVFMMLFLLLLLVLAGLGIGIATRALRQIRDSGGKLAGTTRAKFAALMWPWLSIVFMVSYGIFILTDPVLGKEWNAVASVPVFASSVLGFVMIRQISRWLKNARPAKVSGHVWRFAIVTALAMSVVSTHLQERKSAMHRYLIEGGAKMTVKIKITAGTTMHFKLIRVDTKGKETPLELQSSIHAPDDQELHTQLEINLTDRWKNNPRQKLTASVKGLNGQNSSRTILLDDLWVVTDIRKGNEMVMENVKQRWEFATRHDWVFGTRVETLYLEVVSTKKQP